MDRVSRALSTESANVKNNIQMRRTRKFHLLVLLLRHTFRNYWSCVLDFSGTVSTGLNDLINCFGMIFVTCPTKITLFVKTHSKSH